MSWLAALPLALVATAWLLVPGLAIASVLGLRGTTAWGVAPAVSVGSTALTAVAAQWLGIPWSPATAAGGAVVVAVAALAARRFAVTSGPAVVDGRALGAAAAAGVLGAAGVVALTVPRAVRTPETLSQTYDAVFHYNAVAMVLANRDASSLTVGTLADPGAAVGFYPAAWHDLVSLVVLTSGASVPVASNVVAVVVAAVAWPLSCLVLARQAIGRSMAANLVTPLLALGFGAFPWMLMSWGVVWPNLLGVALLPVGLAVVVTLCGLARDSAMTVHQASAVGGPTVVALALAHPNTVFSLVATSVFPFLWWTTARIRGLAAAGHRLGAAAVAIAPLVVAAVGLYLVLAAPVFAVVQSFDWPAYQTPAQGVVEVLLNATNSMPAAWLLAVAVVAGMLGAAWVDTTRWLIPAHLTSGALFILASSMETPLAALLTAPWYNDAHRLAGMLPVTGVLLATIGVLAIGRTSGWCLRGLLARVRPTWRPDVVAVAVAALLAVVLSGTYVPANADVLRASYAEEAAEMLVEPEQREFLEQVAATVPPGAVVAQNPWTGSALLWALTGTRVLFPHLDGTWTADQRLLADRLAEAGTDPAVCSAAQRLDVGYVLLGEVRFWPSDGRTQRYPGIENVASAPGFALLAAGAGYRFYRIDACAPPEGITR